MTLANGDLTTPALYANWIGLDPTKLPIGVAQFINSMSRMILSKLNRAPLYSQTYVRRFNGEGTGQILLPDYPVTLVSAVQQGGALVPFSPIAAPQAPYSQPGIGTYYGIRYLPWNPGDMPGQACMLEYVGNCFWPGYQNISVTYTAGYLIQNEAATVPAVSPWQVTVVQPYGIWCRDGGVTYASSGTALVPVAASPAAGQYIPPSDANPGVYTFSTADAGVGVLISYSFVPADLTEACNQMVAERLSYRGRVGEISKSLGGQETMRWMRGGMGGYNSGNPFPDIPPEVVGLIWPYVSVTSPAMGADT